VEITPVERSLTDLDLVRRLNLTCRVARGDGAAPAWRATEDVLAALFQPDQGAMPPDSEGIGPCEVPG